MIQPNEATMQTAIVTTDPYSPVRASDQTFEPASIPEAMRLAQLLVASRLLPKSVTTPEAAFVIMATGRELGLTTMQAFRSIHVVDGKPALSADLLLGMIKSKRSVCSYFMLVESTEDVARYRTKRVGEPDSTEMQFTIADARRAGLTDRDNWRKYPAAMLRARCIASLARAVYPDLAMGLYDPDELAREAPVTSPPPVPVAAIVATQPGSDREHELAAAAYCKSMAALIDEAESKPELMEVIDSIRSARSRGIIDGSHVIPLRERWISRSNILRESDKRAEPEAGAEAAQ